ncbi:unnamed protein product [Arctia plantaginis]|uniref:PiggyBac transposable element-derived protein domain-containing protein n=1 Tax=Arctia plantaginis TaxID=874455 RepID=A0A8S0ZMG8_ARCPL|nr:unnamed protein product [Arctia plantaginis]
MSNRLLRDNEIQDYLDIPSGSEDEEDHSEAESDDDINNIQSTLNLFAESTSDIEISRSLSPATVDVRGSTSQPSTSGAFSESTLDGPRQSRNSRRSSISIPLANRTKNQFSVSYYTSPELISYLAKEGIQSLGTVNKGRLGKDLQKPSLKDPKKDKVERGFSEEWVADADGTDVVTVLWYDNKPVVLSSSFVGQQPSQSVKRYCKKQKKYIQVDCPQVVKTYNQHIFLETRQ